MGDHDISPVALRFSHEDAGAYCVSVTLPLHFHSKGLIVMSLSQEALGRRLAHAREAAGLTQVQVGQYLKMPREYVSYVEHGRRPIQIPVLQQLADLYGIHMGRLFEDPADDTYDPALSVVAAFRSPETIPSIDPRTQQQSFQIIIVSTVLPML